MSKNNEIFNVPKSLIVRYHDEGENSLPEYRTEFMRDRDRLMYATAFRRLSGKTQIYTVGNDDHRKNRLTHTLEVSQIARTIAIALEFNPDLAEAIALAHDFGHTPFGHAGERMLHDILIPNSSFIKKSPFYHKDYTEIERKFERESQNKKEALNYIFGFKHNIQSVRVAALLEDSYRNKEKENIGLNLTNFTLYGMMIHSSLSYNDSKACPNFQNFFGNQMKLKDNEEMAWSFEAYIVRWADDIAQWHHDLEDAMREGVLPLKKICETIKESLEEALDEVDKEKISDIADATEMDRKCIAELSHIVVNTLVNDLVATSRENLKNLKEVLEQKGITKAEQFFKEVDKPELGIDKEKVIYISDKIKSDKFKNLIKASIHHSRNVERMNEKGKYIIRKLFEAYYAHPQQLPNGPILHLLVDIDLSGYEDIEADNYNNIDDAQKVGIGQARVDFDKVIRNPNVYIKCMLMRRICDHIASMTDHYAIEEYNNLYG